MEFLVENGADTSVEDDEGYTALVWASKKDNLDFSRGVFILKINLLRSVKNFCCFLLLTKSYFNICCSTRSSSFRAME